MSSTAAEHPPQPAHAASTSSLAPQPFRLVQLNVGGTVFCTSEETLMWPGPDTFFGGACGGGLSGTT